jgi:predicted DNA-binding ribbon-helix-helix protein
LRRRGAALPTLDPAMGGVVPPSPPRTSEGQAVTPRISGRPAKRSFTIDGHRTSISLEAPFWDALKAAADADGLPVSRLIAHIDAARTGCGLSSAIRVWLLARYRKGAT